MSAFWVSLVETPAASAKTLNQNTPSMSASPVKRHCPFVPVFRISHRFGATHAPIALRAKKLTPVTEPPPAGSWLRGGESDFCESLAQTSNHNRTVYANCLVLQHFISSSLVQTPLSH